MVVALAAIGAGLAASQSQAQQQLNQAFSTRADIAGQLAASYVSDVFSREVSVAADQLAGPTVDDAIVRAVAQSFGFTAAVVLDANGAALDVVPATPGRLGTNLAALYAHLRSAEGGVPTVSHVVASFAEGRPVVAFAVPYSTPYGRRVFSGGFDVNATPLATYLDNSVPLSDAEVYLVDQQTGTVVADTPDPTANATPLAAQDPALAEAAAGAGAGNFSDPQDGASYFVQRDVPNSPWRIVMSVSDATLYAPLDGGATWAPWVLFALLAVGALAFWRLLGRLGQSGRSLTIANADLVLLARIDKLTGVYNRRHIEEQLDMQLHTAAREGSALSLLMIDVDHFKRVNDTEGHVVGDHALQSIATAIRLVIRPGDVLGRWGGEEFVVLLPATEGNAAREIADRVREAAAETPVTGRIGEPLHLTISVGVAASQRTDIPSALIGRADAALYRAKDGGRNAVAA